MEAMTQEFMLHRRPHAEIWSAREGSNDNTSKIHFRNKSLMDPKQCQQRTTDPPQKSDGSQQEWSISDTTKLREKPNHKKEAASATNGWQHPTKLNLTTCPFESTSEIPDATSATNGWQHLTHIWRPKQDMNQTQVFFPGSDYTSYQE